MLHHSTVLVNAWCNSTGLASSLTILRQTMLDTSPGLVINLNRNSNYVTCKLVVLSHHLNFRLDESGCVGIAWIVGWCGLLVGVVGVVG